MKISTGYLLRFKRYKVLQTDGRRRLSNMLPYETLKTTEENIIKFVADHFDVNIPRSAP